MNTPHPTAQRLIAALAQHLHTDLRLEEGVCALYDMQSREAVVIEIPDNSDTAILHCEMDVPPHSPNLHKRMLELNFRLDTLRGCWLAIDDQNAIRLCAQCPLEMLDEKTFCHWVVGFMAQVPEIRPLLVQGSPQAPRPATPNMIRTRLG
jgi:hypothetical protein